MDTALIYLGLGFEHILPLGLDHILFILCLFLSSSNFKTLIWQVTAFTLAHCFTLALAMLQVITISSSIIEPIIALSIAFLAIENSISTTPKQHRIFIVFLFGLVHGLGFASVLNSLGVSQDNFLISLVSFNVGVELGQITILLLAWLLVGKWFSQKEGYRKWFIIPTSAVIALIAVYWTIERIFFA